MIHTRTRFAVIPDSFLIMYHVPRMNKDTIQNIFIGILLGGVILLAGGVYYLAMQVQTAAQGIQRIEQGMMEASQKADDAMMKAEESSMKADEAMMKAEENAMMESRTQTYTSWDLAFDYPSDWYVETYDVVEQFPLEEAQGTFLRLTSSPGVLERLAALYTDEVGVPPQTFEEGMLVDMRKSRYQDPPTTERTKYANIWRVVGEECDALTCPNERYTVSSAETVYVIDFYYTDGSYARYIDMILSSLK